MVSRTKLQFDLTKYGFKLVKNTFEKYVVINSNCS